MSIIFHILEEEYDRLLEAERVYRKCVENAVQGAARVKHIGRKDYLYLEKRIGKRVVYEYIGHADGEKASAIIEAVKRRNKDRASLRKVRNDLKEVGKVMRGKVRTSLYRSSLTPQGRRTS